MTGPRLTVRTVCVLIFISLCVAGVICAGWMVERVRLG